MARLLIVDDEEGYCSVLKVVFEKEGHIVDTASNGVEALEHIRGSVCDLIISDVKMPDMGGIALLKKARETAPDIRVVMMTAFASLEVAREAFVLGADDFIQKPFQNDELKLIVKRTLEKQAIINENRAFRRAQKSDGHIDNIIGESESIRKLCEMIRTISGEDSTVLVTGESGTGKELAARAIHSLSGRNDKPFIPINCGAIPEHLLEAELFGFLKGSFTGAISDREGLFEAAGDGTVFLDEIGDMPLAMQVKVLRVLQDNMVRPVGSSSEIPVNARIIAATNTDINEKIEDGSFRRDLYYRISVMPLTVPPLRERTEDIPILVEHFIAKFCAKSKKNVTISDDALASLKTRSWVGNVRELEHVIERAVVLTKDGGTIETQDCLVDPEISTSPATEYTLPDDGLHLPSFLNELEKSMAQEALSRFNGNQTNAAKLLQIPVHAFRHLMSKHGLKSKGEFKATHPNQ
ncbi:MAG: sigma-54-dependent Fis family transcriptional regulator [Pyrinomonadaceae bacterium]|nr:sigma-54-dependent Fis family transcriptional regulator [Pyrinomonadaceae bacterium]